MNIADPLVDVANLTKRYEGRTAVSNVTLRLKRGEMVGLVGANGGGKTTTLRMLAGLIQPDAGTGHILGGDVFHPRPALRRYIGYMGQRLALYPDLSVAENLSFYAAVHGLMGGKALITRSIERYGLSEVINKRFGQLSGGWARRVQFAATMLHEPPLMLLDEPTAGLDSVTRRDIWQWLADLAKAGHAIVVSTHDLAEAERLPALIVFHEGHAQATTTLAQITADTATTTLEAALFSQIKKATA